MGTVRYPIGGRQSIFTTLSQGGIDLTYQMLPEHLQIKKGNKLDDIQDDQFISISENVLYQELAVSDGEVVLLDMQSGGYFGLNDVGSSFWRVIKEGKTLADVISGLIEEYDVSEDQIRGDLAFFLAELRDRGLIELR